MISAFSLKLFVTSVRWAYYLRIIPFSWDRHAQKLCHITSMWDVWSNRAVNLFVWAWSVFITARYTQLLLQQSPGVSRRSYVVHGIQTSGALLFALILLAGHLKKGPILGFVNRFLQFFMYAQE